MSFTIHTDVPPLRESDDGAVRIGNTRIPLERVVRAFLAGQTPEQIAQNFDVLRLEDVYAVVNYYLHHRAEIDAYLAAAETEASEAQSQIESQFDPSGIRARLLARTPHEAD